MPFPAAGLSTSSMAPMSGPSPLQPFGSPMGDDTVSINSGMFSDLMPAIPNLEFGYTYSFGPQVGQGRAWGDYLLPVETPTGGMVFGEVHGEFESLWTKPSVDIAQIAGFRTTAFKNKDRIDLSFGGGYRTIVNGNMMLGGNAFYDSSRIFKKWYSSGGFGLEMAVNTFTNAAFDLNFNYYGNLFTRGTFINAWRSQRGSFDFEAGYSQGLLDNSVDLRLKTVGYGFDVGQRIWGWKVGGDLTARNGVVAFHYEYGQDKLNDSYHEVGVQVNIGFQLENLLSGESPLTMPAPVFVNPRNLGRLLSQKVKRNWHQPSAVVASTQTPVPGLSFDRVVAPFALTYYSSPVAVYTALHPFTSPFPRASLTPTGIIHVTITLTNAAAAGQFISVAVIGADNVTSNQGYVVATGGETTLTIALTSVSPQSLFISAPTDPSQITISVYPPFTTDGIQSVGIQFNQ